MPQFDSNHLFYVIRYVAIRSATEEQKNKSRLSILEKERNFFMTNLLLSGLRHDRWGNVTLKQLVINFQVTRSWANRAVCCQYKALG